MRWSPTAEARSADLGNVVLGLVWCVRGFPSPVPGSALGDERLSRPSIPNG
jgi:hypothetical protein